MTAASHMWIWPQPLCVPRAQFSATSLTSTSDTKITLHQWRLWRAAFLKTLVSSLENHSLLIKRRKHVEFGLEPNSEWSSSSSALDHFCKYYFILQLWIVTKSGTLCNVESQCNWFTILQQNCIACHLNTIQMDKKTTLGSELGSPTTFMLL